MNEFLRFAGKHFSGQASFTHVYSRNPRSNELWRVWGSRGYSLLSRTPGPPMSAVRRGLRPSRVSTVWSREIAFVFMGTMRSMERERMFCWASRFLAIAAAEAIVGWTGVAGAATAISWLLCVLFLSVALLSGRGA